MPNSSLLVSSGNQRFATSKYVLQFKSSFSCFLYTLTCLYITILQILLGRYKQLWFLQRDGVSPTMNGKCKQLNTLC